MASKRSRRSRRIKNHEYDKKLDPNESDWAKNR